MKNFINWIRPSFQDNDGTASYRRITAFLIICLVSYMVLGGVINTDLWLHAFYALLITFLLLVGIVTAQNILTFFSKKSDEKEN